MCLFAMSLDLSELRFYFATRESRRPRTLLATPVSRKLSAANDWSEMREPPSIENECDRFGLRALGGLSFEPPQAGVQNWSVAIR